MHTYGPKCGDSWKSKSVWEAWTARAGERESIDTAFRKAKRKPKKLTASGGPGCHTSKHYDSCFGAHGSGNPGASLVVNLAMGL